MEFLNIVFMSVLSLLVLFVLAKLMGYKEISQLSLFDYIIGISIGSIASEMATNIDVKWWHGVTPMCIYAGAALLISAITQKSIKARKLIEGTPIVLISNGKIDKKAMKKARIEIDELLSTARNMGFFNLADVDTAVMETSGKISFLPIAMQRPLNPKDFNFAPSREGLCYTVVSDGRILRDNLIKANISEAKLMEILQQRGEDVNNILLATVNEAGRVDIFNK